MASTVRPFLLSPYGKYAAIAASSLFAATRFTDDCSETTRCSWFWPNSSLPRPLQPNDPIWTLTKSQLRRRARDEEQAQKLLEEIKKQIQARHSKGHLHPLDPKEEEDFRTRIARLQSKWLDTVYGSGFNLQDRQHFLEEYGCTGFTEEVLDCILRHKLGGIVEMGAGNGQWARALSDRYQKSTSEKTSHDSDNKAYEVIIAYDDMSQLPLNPNVYHAKTQPAHDHFGNVRPLLGESKITSAEAIEFTLQQWQCRGRALLLVYPPPGSNMAEQCARAYVSLAQEQHTILYVGEGRGGATANDDFFDYMESTGWLICDVREVKRFGTKGYEKLYVLEKMKQEKQ